MSGDLWRNDKIPRNRTYGARAGTLIFMMDMIYAGKS